MSGPVLVVATFAAALCVLGLSAAVLRRRFVVITIKGFSMAPTLVPGDRAIVARRSFRALECGRVVVAVPPYLGGDTRPHWSVKRVAALPGDPVPEAVRDAVGAAPGEVVPAGAFVVLGDNPDFSTDSRYWGYLRAQDVVGIMVRRSPRGARAAAAVPR